MQPPTDIFDPVVQSAQQRLLVSYLPPPFFVLERAPLLQMFNEVKGGGDMKIQSLSILFLTLASLVNVACGSEYRAMNTGSSVTTTIAAKDPVTIEVENIYQTVLARSPKQMESDTIVRAIKHEGYSKELIRYGLAFSDEAKEKVRGFFTKHLAREGLEDELFELQSQLGTDHTLRQIETIVKTLKP